MADLHPELDKKLAEIVERLLPKFIVVEDFPALDKSIRDFGRTAVREAADAALEQRAEEVAALRVVVKLIIGRYLHIPWPEIPESDVDAYVAEAAALRREKNHV